MAREGRTGLGFADRLVLLMAWIATCGLVYLLGFYVGKGTQEHRLGVEEQIVRLPVTSRPPPEGQRAKTENEFGFYEKLMGDHPGGEAAPRSAAEERAPVPPAPAPAPTVKAVATAVLPSAPATTPPKTPVAVAVPAKLPAATAVATAVPAAARTPVPVPPPPPAKPLAPPSRPTMEPAAIPVTPPHPAPPPIVASHPAVSTPPTPPPHVAASGGWTVLANPTQNRDEADSLTRQLRGRGYDATLVRVVRDGGTWYRVQVGRFATSDEASETMHRLREHEGVTHAFVASE